MNRFKEFRREKRVKLTPSTPKGIGERNNASVVNFQLFFIATSKVQSAEGIKQKSPGIVMMPSYPSVVPGEDQTSYERHTKTLQVRMRDHYPVMIIIVHLCVSNDDNGVSIHE